MKKALIASLIALLIFSFGCSGAKDTNKLCTFTGDKNGMTMSWEESGAKEKPSVVWEYNEKSVYSPWYYTFGNLNVCGDVIYTGGDRLTAINLKTGKEIWETQVKNSLPDENGITYVLCPTIYKDKIVSLGARLVNEKGSEYNFERRNILVFDKNTGKLLWKSCDIGSKTDYFDGGFPVVLNNKIYVPALNGEYRASEPGFGFGVSVAKEERGIYVWDLNTGKLINKIVLKFPEGYLDPEFSLISTDGRYIYVSAGVLPTVGKVLHSTYIFAYDPVGNKVVWKTQVSDTLLSSEYYTFGTSNNAVIRFCDIEPTKSHGPNEVIKAIDKKTGKILWSKNITLPDICIAVNGDKLIFQTAENTIGCFDVETGKEIWQYKYSPSPSENGQITKHLFFSPAFANGVVYLLEEHIILALDPETGKELWRIFVPNPKNLDDEETEVMTGWRFIPVDNGFVTMNVVSRFSSDSMIHPPFLRLWLNRK